MTFLELCQRLHQETAVSGSGPAAVTGRQGIEKRIVDWVNSAWMEIQRKHRDWLFMRKQFEFSTVAGVAEYSATSVNLPVAAWDLSTITCRRTDGDEALLEPVYYPDYQRYLAIGTQRNARPSRVAVSSAKALLLWQIPDDVYAIRGSYFAQPSLMENNEDVPAMPEQYHEAIVFLAMQYYGRGEAASEVLVDGMSRYKSIMSMMEVEQLPEVEFGGALV